MTNWTTWMTELFVWYRVRVKENRQKLLKGTVLDKN